MSRYKVPIAALIVFSLIAILFCWPVAHSALIRQRIKSEIGRSRHPLPAISTVHGAISEIDPPHRVLNVLWDMAVSPQSTKSQMHHAGNALNMLCARLDTLVKGKRYTQKDWDDALTALLNRERANRPAMNSNVKQWFDQIDQCWNASTPVGVATP